MNEEQFSELVEAFDEWFGSIPYPFKRGEDPTGEIGSNWEKGCSEGFRAGHEKAKQSTRLTQLKLTSVARRVRERVASECYYDNMTISVAEVLRIIDEELEKEGGEILPGYGKTVKSEKPKPDVEEVVRRLKEAQKDFRATNYIEDKMTVAWIAIDEAIKELEKEGGEESNP